MTYTDMRIVVDESRIGQPMGIFNFGAETVNGVLPELRAFHAVTLVAPDNPADRSAGIVYTHSVKGTIVQLENQTHAGIITSRVYYYLLGRQPIDSNPGSVLATFAHEWGLSPDQLINLIYGNTVQVEGELKSPE